MCNVSHLNNSQTIFQSASSLNPYILCNQCLTFSFFFMFLEYIAAVSSTNLQSSQQTDSYNRSLVSPSSNLNGEVVREEIVNTGAQQSVPNSIISQSQPSQCG